MHGIKTCSFSVSVCQFLWLSSPGTIFQSTILWFLVSRFVSVLFFNYICQLGFYLQKHIWNLPACLLALFSPLPPLLHLYHKKLSTSFLWTGLFECCIDVRFSVPLPRTLEQWRMSESVWELNRWPSLWETIGMAFISWRSVFSFLSLLNKKGVATKLLFAFCIVFSFLITIF